MDSKPKFKTVDEYISIFPENIRIKLKQIRNEVKQIVPEAKELISYNMPAFKYHGILVYYAAHKEHIGFYPGSSIANEYLKEDLAGYETSKGTIKSPMNKYIPLILIKKIVKY